MNWVSVKDQLPKENEKVMVFTSDSDLLIASLVCSDFDDSFYYLWDVICYEHLCHSNDFNVIYWMPLPKPPEEK